MLSFIGIGWEKRLRKVKNEYTLSFAKELIIGNALRKGEPLCYFLVHYNNRNAILVFLDGEGYRVTEKEQITLKQFVLKERKL